MPWFRGVRCVRRCCGVRRPASGGGLVASRRSGTSSGRAGAARGGHAEQRVRPAEALRDPPLPHPGAAVDIRHAMSHVQVHRRAALRDGQAAPRAPQSLACVDPGAVGRCGPGVLEQAQALRTRDACGHASGRGRGGGARSGSFDGCGEHRVKNFTKCELSNHRAAPFLPFPSRHATPTATPRVPTRASCCSRTLHGTRTPTQLPAATACVVQRTTRHPSVRRSERCSAPANHSTTERVAHGARHY